MHWRLSTDVVHYASTLGWANSTMKYCFYGIQLWFPGLQPLPQLGICTQGATPLDMSLRVEHTDPMLPAAPQAEARSGGGAPEVPPGGGPHSGPLPGSRRAA
jgi:hypothetical protein